MAKKEKNEVMINDDWKITCDRFCWVLKKRRKGKEDNFIDDDEEEKELGWVNIGYYGSLKDLIRACCEREIYENDVISKFKMLDKKITELIERIPNLLMKGDEQVILKDKIVKVTEKIHYMTFQDARKKPIAFFKETKAENSIKVKETVLDSELNNKKVDFVKIGSEIGDKKESISIDLF